MANRTERARIPRASSARAQYSRTRVSAAIATMSAIAAIAVALVTWSLWNTDWSARPPSVIGVPIAILVIILAVGAIFSCFTVEVRDGTLAWWFGFGAFRHEVRVSAIADARVARTSWAEVHDIARRRPERAYGTSGGEAVALRLYDGSSLKLQAQEPEALLMVLGR